MITLHTTIDSKYKLMLLKRGSSIAALGLFAMLFASIEIGPKLLSETGIFIFLFGVSVIAYGLLPYRKIMRLELAPHHLFIGDDRIEYVHGKIIECIKIDEIESLEYYEEFSGYGIKVTKKNGTKLMMPFFSKRSCERLTNELNHVVDT